MPHKLEITGERFGKLEVVGHAPSRRGRGFYRCRCDCGQELELRADRLKPGGATHCGCSPPTGPKFDLTGQRFGRLEVLRLADFDRVHRWECQCDCGAVQTIPGQALRSGHTKSCGCLQRQAAAKQARVMGAANATHKRCDTPEYVCWRNMWRRCTDSECHEFGNYGGREITVCDRWEDFSLFFADMGARPGRGYSIDRIDVNGNYEPGNCRWATAKEQQRNRRNNIVIQHDGLSLCISEWAERCGMPTCTLWGRLADGWDFAAAISKPVRQRQPKRAAGPPNAAAGS